VGEEGGANTERKTLAEEDVDIRLLVLSFTQVALVTCPADEIPVKNRRVPNNNNDRFTALCPGLPG